MSTWLGPPFIIRKMQLFAFAAKCGGLRRERTAGAGRFAAAGVPGEETIAVQQADSARPAKPAPISQTNSRRVWPQGNRRGSRPALLVDAAMSDYALACDASRVSRRR